MSILCVFNYEYLSSQLNTLEFSNKTDFFKHQALQAYCHILNIVYVSEDPDGKHTLHKCTHSDSSNSIITLTDVIYSLTGTHNRPCIIIGGGSRQVSRKQVGVCTESEDGSEYHHGWNRQV
jgi:hypothetical protein